MRTRLLLLALVVAPAPGLCAEAGAKPGRGRDAKIEPKLASIYPAGGQRGTSFDAVLRGSYLEGARVIGLEPGIEISVLGAEADPEVDEKSGKQALRVRVTLGQEVA